jgi:hypothetical protein
VHWCRRVCRVYLPSWTRMPEQTLASNSHMAGVQKLRHKTPARRQSLDDFFRHSESLTRAPKRSGGESMSNIRPFLQRSYKLQRLWSNRVSTTIEFSELPPRLQRPVSFTSLSSNVSAHDQTLSSLHTSTPIRAVAADCGQSTRVSSGRPAIF